MVLVIAGALLTLVAPLGLSAVERARIQTELASVERWVRHTGHRAFLSSAVIMVKGDDSNMLVAQMHGQAIDSFALDLLQMGDDFLIEFSRAGLPSTETLAFTADDKNYEIDLTISAAPAMAY